MLCAASHCYRFLGNSKLEQRKAGNIPMRLIIGIMLTREEETV